MQMQPVDPSVSRTPLPLDADDVATACVLCSHNCGLAGHVWMPNGFGMHFPGVEGLVGAGVDRRRGRAPEQLSPDQFIWAR